MNSSSFHTGHNLCATFLPIYTDFSIIYSHYWLGSWLVGKLGCHLKCGWDWHCPSHPSSYFCREWTYVPDLAIIVDAGLSPEHKHNIRWWQMSVGLSVSIMSSVCNEPSEKQREMVSWLHCFSSWTELCLMSALFLVFLIKWVPYLIHQHIHLAYFQNIPRI